MVIVVKVFVRAMVAVVTVVAILIIVAAVVMVIVIIMVNGYHGDGCSRCTGSVVTVYVKKVEEH